MMDDDDDLDGIEFPPELAFTEENIRRVMEASDADIAAGRLVPVEEVLESLKRYEEKARAIAATRTAAE